MFYLFKCYAKCVAGISLLLNAKCLRTLISFLFHNSEPSFISAQKLNIIFSLPWLFVAWKVTVLIDSPNSSFISFLVGLCCI